MKEPAKFVGISKTCNHLVARPEDDFHDRNSNQNIGFTFTLDIVISWWSEGKSFKIA